MARWISDSEVREVLDYSAAVAALESAFRAAADTPPPTALRSRLPLAAGGGLSSLGAELPWAGLAGVKTYMHRDGRTESALLLFDTEAGELLSVIAARFLGEVRTGATCGVATEWLAPRDAGRVALLGAGAQALMLLRAVCGVRPVDEVRVFSREPQRRLAFARAAEREFGLRVEASESAEAAVRGADIVCTATSSPAAVFAADWLGDDAHVNAIGAGAEVDPAYVARCRTVVVDCRAQAAAYPLELAGVLDYEPERIRELSEIVAGAPAIHGERGPSLFRCFGWGVEDTVLGCLIYRAAVREGIGTEVSLA